MSAGCMPSYPDLDHTFTSPTFVRDCEKRLRIHSDGSYRKDDFIGLENRDGSMGSLSAFQLSGRTIGEQRKNYVDEDDKVNNSALLWHDGAPKDLKSPPFDEIISSQHEVESIFMVGLTLGYGLFVGIEAECRYDSSSMSIQHYFSSTWILISSVYGLFTLAYILEMLYHLRTTSIQDYFHSPRRQSEFFFLSCSILNFVLSLGVVPFIIDFRNELELILVFISLLRICAILRLLHTIKPLQVIITALTASLRALVVTAVFLLLFIFVFANLATRTLAENTDDELMERLWGSFASSMYALYMIVTLDGIFDFVSDTIRAHQMSQRPLVALFFVLFIVSTSILWLNVVTGVIVDSYLHASRDLHRQRDAEKTVAIHGATISRLKAIFHDDDEDDISTRDVPIESQEFDEEMGNTKDKKGSKRSAERNDEGKLLWLKGRNAWELLMEPSWRRVIKSVQVPEHRAYDVVTILIDFGIESMTVKDFAEACLMVGGDSTGRELLISQLEQRQGQQAIDTRVRVLNRVMARTKCNIMKLLSLQRGSTEELKTSMSNPEWNSNRSVTLPVAQKKELFRGREDGNPLATKTWYRGQSSISKGTDSSSRNNSTDQRKPKKAFLRVLSLQNPSLSCRLWRSSVSKLSREKKTEEQMPSQSHPICPNGGKQDEGQILSLFM